MAVIANNQNWINFINVYKNLPQLWDTKCVGYKNKTKRIAAYEKLTKVYQRNIDKSANVETVKRRIKNMRVVYKRELRRKLKAKKRGESPYEPNLWYFHHFGFLKELEMSQKPGSLVDGEEEENDCVPTCPSISAKSKTPLNAHYKNELLYKASMFLDNANRTKEKDEADIYGETWTYSYRKLTAEQKLFAKKAIDEIFILGLLDKLTLNSVRSETFHICKDKAHSPVDFREEEII